MRKAIAMVLVLCLGGIVSAFAAPSKPVTVSMMQLKVEIKDALDAYAAKYSAAHPGVTVSVETLGGGADFGGALKAKIQAGQMPDIFVIEGMGQYNVFKDYIADLGDQPWVKDTDLAFKVERQGLRLPGLHRGLRTRLQRGHPQEGRQSIPQR